MKIIYTDVLVIGGGLAGLRMAVAAKRRGHDSIVLSLVPPKRSHSKAAQGGMQASLGNVIKGVGDNEDVHFGDTVRGSDWGADQEVVRMFVNTSRRPCVSSLPGVCPGAASPRVIARSSSMVKRSPLPNARKLPASSPSVTSAARRSGVPATCPTVPVTPCSTPFPTASSPNRSRSSNALKPSL